jgi:hypothetical protein
MRFQVVVAVAGAALISSPALAWGKTGHRVVAAIADTQLSGLARAHVEQILGRGESLDEAANWPDEMRADPSSFWQKTATPWHYVTVNGTTHKIPSHARISFGGRASALRAHLHDRSCAA